MLLSGLKGVHRDKSKLPQSPLFSWRENFKSNSFSVITCRTSQSNFGRHNQKRALVLTRAPQSFANSTAEVQDCHIYNTVVRGIIIESYAALEELQKWTTRLARKRDEKRWIIWFSINI